MAHSGKSITFGADLLPNETNIYSLGSDTKKWKFVGSLTGNATNVTGTVAIGNGGTNATSFTDDCIITAQTTNSTQSLASTGLKATTSSGNVTLVPNTSGKTLTIQSGTGGMTIETSTGALTIQSNYAAATSGNNIVIQATGSTNSGTVTLRSVKSSVSITSGTTLSLSADTTLSLTGTQGTTINSGTGYATIFKIANTEHGRFNPSGMFQLNDAGTQSTHRLYVNGDSAFNGKIAFGAQASNTITNKAYMQWNATDLSIDFIFT